MYNKVLKIRIYPNQVQKEFFQCNFDSTRFIYNKLLEIRTQYFITYSADKEKLRQFKYPTEKVLKEEFKFLKDADSQALQQARIDLDTAFKNYFRRIKEKRIINLSLEELKVLSNLRFKSEVLKFIKYHPHHPVFKSAKKCESSYRTHNTHGFIIIDNEKRKIRITKIGWVKFRHSSSILENIKSVTISRNLSNEYYASLLYEDINIVEKINEININDCIGLDMSAHDFAIASNDEVFENKKFYRRAERRLKIRQRKLSKKEFGSNNRKKARLIVARTHQKITNQKDYFLHGLTKYLSDKYKAIFIEDLNIRGMQKFNSGLAKTISQDLSWSKFTTILNYKMNWKGRYLIKIDKWFPSSKLCSVCGQINNDLTLADRSWVCDCGIIHNRDKNAAINILKEGINLLKKSTVVITESYASRDTNGVTCSACEDLI